jgi:deoxyribodipyrimidine photo-lyase
VGRGGVTVVLFTRDLRLGDHPALAAACRSGPVVPLFVLDPAVLARAAANRTRFLLECLADLRAALRQRGGDLIVRGGETVAEAMSVARAVGATGLVVSEDVSAFAQRREAALSVACADAGVTFRAFAGVTVVPPGELLPSGGGGHFRVFTPYWRKWSAAPWRAQVPVPRRVVLPDGVAPGGIPPWRDVASGPVSPHVVPGGEQAGRLRLDAWLARGTTDVWETSRLSPYLKFGCVSPLEVALRAQRRDRDEFVRQLCWRDFFHQVTADVPSIRTADYRPSRARAWRRDARALRAWAEGRTGVPLVDAGMRHLLDEGWMPGRARMVAASYLTKTLGLDWRAGAAHFDAWLVDGDVACNYGNWQWVAGTGNDTRPNRVLNPLVQARRFDPGGEYVSAWT